MSEFDEILVPVWCAGMMGSRGWTNHHKKKGQVVGWKTKADLNAAIQRAKDEGRDADYYPESAKLVPEAIYWAEEDYKLPTRKQPAINKTCSRCNGHGYLAQFDHVDDGTCFNCDGTGLDPRLATDEEFADALRRQREAGEAAAARASAFVKKAKDQKALLNLVIGSIVLVIVLAMCSS